MSSSFVLPLLGGMAGAVAVSLYQRKKTGQWSMSREAYKRNWAASRYRPRTWLLYAVMFGAMGVLAAVLDQPLAVRIVEAVILGGFALVALVQAWRSGRAPQRES